MIIRSEIPSDIDAITEVIKISFKDHSFQQQTEHFIVRDLRSAGALTLSFVAEVDEQVVGHIAFSPVLISDGTQHWYGLGPLSVLPEFQGCRIGTKLVNKGLTQLKSMGSNGCAIVGLPVYYHRFGFKNHPQLIHKEVPQEVLVVRSLSESMPIGTLEFHEAFKQLSIVEKDAVADAIIEYDIDGIKVDLENPAIESLIEKEIMFERPDGNFMLRPSVLGAYDPYFAKVYQFRATEMSRVHKNPILSAIRH